MTKQRKPMKRFGQIKPGACRSCWVKRQRELRAKRVAERAGMPYVPEPPPVAPRIHHITADDIEAAQP